MTITVKADPGGTFGVLQVGGVDKATFGNTGGALEVSTKAQMDSAISTAINSGNAKGARTVSTLAPSGGVDGDVWYKV